MSGWHAAYDAIVERDGVALKPGVARAARLARCGSASRARSRRRRAARARARSSSTPVSLRRFDALVGGDEVAQRQARARHLHRRRGAAGRARPPTASCSRIRTPACSARWPPACRRSWFPTCCRPRPTSVGPARSCSRRCTTRSRTSPPLPGCASARRTIVRYSARSCARLRRPDDRPTLRHPAREEPAADPARRAGVALRGRRADEHVLQPAGHRASA